MPESAARKSAVRKSALAALRTALVTLLALLLPATPVDAAPTATVVISQSPTQSLVISVDTRGTGTFTKSRPASQEGVSLLGLASVTIATDVMLALPSGNRKLADTGVLAAAAEESATVPDALGTLTLLAVLLLSVVSVGLVRTTVLSRRTKKVGAHSAR